MSPTSFIDLIIRHQQADKRWHISIRVLLLLFIGSSPIISQSQDSLVPYYDEAICYKADSLIDEVALLEDQPRDTSIALCEKALPLYKQIGDWYNYIRIMNMLSRLYFENQDFDTSLNNITLAFTLKEYLYPSDKPYQDALFNEAAGLAARGQYQQAIEVQKEYCALQASTSNNPIDEADCYHNMGSFYKELGDFDEAIRYAQQALQIRKLRGNPQDYNIPSILAEIAHSYLLKGELNNALITYTECLKQASLIKKKNKYLHHIILSCYQNLAKISLQKKEEQKCQNYINNALNLQKGQSFARAHETYQTLGRLRISQQKYSCAIKAFQRARDIAKATYNYDQGSENDKHHTVAQALVDLGEVYLLLQKPEEAISYLQQALIENTYDYDSTDFKTLPTYDNFLDYQVALNTLQQISLAYRQRYHKENSLEHLHYALEASALAKEIIIQTRHSYKAQGSKQTLARRAKTIYEIAINTCYDLYDQTADQNYLHLAFDYSESSKAALLMESIQEQSALGIGDIPAHLQDQEHKLRAGLAHYKKIIALARKESDPTIQEKLPEWEKKAFDIREKYLQLIDDFELHYPKYYQLKFNTDTISAKTVQENFLKKGNVMIHYFLGSENNFAFSISPQQIQLHRWPATQQLNEDIQRLRGLIATPPPSTQLPQVYREFGLIAHQLYTQLLEPLCATLPASTDHLIFVPDGVTNYLPFELLLQKAAPEEIDFSPEVLDYLLKGYAISYNYSATLWSEGLRQKNTKAKKALIAFAPDFKSPEALSIRACTDSPSQLLCNEKEVNEIQTIWGGEIKTKTAANKHSFLQDAPLYDIIHLATHACIDEYNAELSQIYFMDSSVNSLDLQNLRLNARLVVLSACNTGSGKLVEGEGVLSLARNFIHAGCPSALMSLWSVDDCKTSDLMISFYQNLANGLSKDAALRQTKLDYLKQTSDKIEAHPYFWAGFVQTGNPQPLSPPSRSGTMILYLGLLLLTGMLGWFLLLHFKNKRSSNL